MTLTNCLNCNAMKRELDSVRSGLVELQQTCESAFKHRFSATKRKSRSSKQYSNKRKNLKKVRRLARMDEIKKDYGRAARRKGEY